MAVSHVELVIRRPGSPDRRIVLQPGVLSIGRADDNDIVLSDIGVSRRHAKLHVEENSVEYEDNGSGNGSLYNGRRFKRQRLVDGDEVVVDPFRLQVLLAAETDEANLSTAATLKLGGLDEGFARLELVSSHRMDRTAFEIPAEGTITLGRGDRNEVVLPEPAASRVHSEIVGHMGNWTVRDRASANGTFVNGRKVREQVLRDGDKLRIGTVELKFFSPGGEGTANFASSAPAAKAPAREANPAPLALPAPARPAPSEVGQRAAARPAASPSPAARGPNPSAGRPTVIHAPSPTLAPVQGAPAVKPKGFFSNPANAALAVVGGLSVVGLVLVAGIAVVAVAWKAQATKATAVAEPALSPATAAQVETLLAGGKKLQSEGKHFDAAAQFYKVLQLDPGNAVAERLGYRACGDIALAEMRTTLPAVSAAAPAAPAAPVAAAPSPAPAARAEPAAERIAPARAPTSAPASYTPVARDVPDLSGTFARGQALADSGDYAGAIKIWQGLMSMDPDHVTPEYYQAEAGVRAARDHAKDDGNKHYQAALTALSAKQYATARQQLELSVAADPLNNAARAKLTQVRNELGAQAQDIYKEARIQEDIDKTSDAIRMYKQVIALVGETDELGAKAKRRMDALQGR